MSYLNKPNENAKTIAPDQAALGPRVGFMESFSASWDAQVRASAQSGMWAAYADEEDAQIRKLKEAGVENMPRIGFDTWSDAINIGGDNDFMRYKAASRFFDGSGDEDTGIRLNAYDKRINELRKERPDLELFTAREMYDRLIEKGREAERVDQTQRRTFGGHVGSFLGGGVASMNPRTDELNFLTLGVGGVGKTAVRRIATEAGAQGVIETINQLTGVQEQREMMGLSSGFEDAATRVAGTALIGGAFQGFFEGAAYAGKRYFSNSKTDAAPPPPDTVNPEQRLLEYKPAEWEGKAAWDADVREYQNQLVRDLMNGTRDYTDDIIPMARYGQTRQGTARARSDMEFVSGRLDAWDGELPVNIKPPARTASAIPGSVRVQSPGIRVDTPGTTIDAMARDIDPKLFMQYDKLADRKAEFQRWLQDPRYKTEQKAATTKAQTDFDELSKRIEALKWNMRNKGRRRQAEMQTKLDGLMQEREAITEKLTARDTPEMAAIRRELIKVDEQMRDFAPAVGRAYAQARNQWDLDEPNRELIRQMVRDGRKELGDDILPDTYENALDIFRDTLETKAPILQETPKVQSQLRPDADAADIAQTILRENQKVIDDAMQSYRDSLDAIVKNAEEGVVTINGERYKFDLDNDTIDVLLPDGVSTQRMTIRELLEDNADTEAELKATQTCSIV